MSIVCNGTTQPSGIVCYVQYAREQMGTHFRFLRKLFCSKIPFVRIPICSRIVSNVFELPVSRKSTFCSRDPCCLTSFFYQNLPIFAKAQQLQGQNPHLFECPFVREKLASKFRPKTPFVRMPICSRAYCS